VCRKESEKLKERIGRKENKSEKDSQGMHTPRPVHAHTPLPKSAAVSNKGVGLDSRVRGCDGELQYPWCHNKEHPESNTPH